MHYWIRNIQFILNLKKFNHYFFMEDLNLDLKQIQETLSKHGYEYIKFLGKGGFSCVLLCQSKKYNQNFAVKRAIKHQLIENEFNHMVSLNHPSIIKLYDSFIDDNAQYLVMEYCPNGTMQQKGKLSYDEFVHYAKQILEAILFCHQRNIAHRDLKPENIFFDQYDHIKLADFGMAKQFEYDEKSAEKCGSLMFVPPEMLQYQEISPFKADIWSLGITFFYMATGEYPFRNSNREELKQQIFRGEIDFILFDIHPKIRFLINKMTTKDQSNRPTAEKLLDLPIFSQTPKPQILSNRSAQKITSSSSHKHIGLNNSILTDFNTSQNNLQAHKDKPKQRANIRSYRSLNLYPNMKRVNSRLATINTF